MFTINDPPVVSQISPPEGGAVNSQSVLISASIRDTHGIKPDSIKFEVSGLGEMPGIYKSDKNTAEIQIALGEGVKQVKMKVEDIYGYRAENIWNFIVDRTRPQIKSTSPSATFNYVSSLPSEISITPIDNESGIDLYSSKTALFLIKNGVNHKLPIDEQARRQGVLEYQLQTATDPYFDVETGYVLRADIYDRAGNGVSHYMTIVYDATRPQVYMQRPLNGSLVNDPFIELVIEDSTSNADEMEFMKFQLSSGGTIVNCVPKKVNKNTVSCDPRLPDGAQIPNGAYRLHIIVADQAGNILNDNSMTFTLDRGISDDDLVNPEITGFEIVPRMLNLFDLSGDNNSAAINFNLVVRSDVTLLIHAMDHSIKPIYPPLRTISAFSMNQGPNSIMWDGKDGNGNIVPDGAYLFRVSATDSGGTGGTYYLQDQRAGASVVGIDEEKEFSPPENNGIDFNFSFNIPSYLTISVLRDTGEIVRHVTYYEAFGTENYHEIWDGRDISEAIIAPGTEFRLTAVPQALPLNSVVMRGNNPAIGLPVAPVLIIGGNNETALIEYTLSESGCAEGCEVTVRVIDKQGNAIGTLIANELKSSGGSYSINWNGSFPYPGGNTLPDGLYTLAFDAVDRNPYSLRAKTRYLSVQIVTPVIFVRNDGFYVITPEGIEVKSVMEDSSKEIQVAPFGMDYLRKGVVPDTSPGLHTFTVEFSNRSISSSASFSVSKNYVFHAPINLMVDRDKFHPGSETLGISFNVEYADQYSIGLYGKIPDQPVTLNDPSKLEHIIRDHEPVSGSGVQQILWDGMLNGQPVAPGKHVLVLFLHTAGVNYSLPYYESWTLNVAD
jgi:flagellar hook assembly protein FlgD